jgi:glycosyltransferase involved in cell wall biosynthesis
MASRPLISIVIPAYNYAEKLPRAVSSVLKQLTDLHELIVIDDGSTDNTQAALTELQYENNNFRIVHKENGGSASARNRGITEAKADYLIFLDADDELDEGALKHIEQHIQANPSSKMIICGYTSVWPDQIKQKLSLPAELPADSVARVKGYLIDKTISLANGATVMHRSLFEKGLYPEHFRNAEDLPVFAQALGNYKCTILKNSIARIHKHETSLRHNVTYDRDVGLALVDEIFNSIRLSDRFNILKKEFIAQRALSLFRGYYVAGLPEDAKTMYKVAIKTDCKSIFKWSYTRKAIKLFLK